jgi:transposase-like protein
VTRLRCKQHEAKRFGFYGRKKIQRCRCPRCNATFSEPRQRPLRRQYTDTAKAAQIVNLLLEGMSVRAVSRITGAHQGTFSPCLLRSETTAAIFSTNGCAASVREFCKRTNSGRSFTLRKGTCLPALRWSGAMPTFGWRLKPIAMPHRGARDCEGLPLPGCPFLLGGRQENVRHHSGPAVFGLH